MSPEPPRPTMTFLSDFPDRISPMLVKELRQGLRAKAFVIQFLAFQGLMLFILLTTASASEGDSAGNTISGIILSFFGIAALFFQPLRGNQALTAEIKGGTMEVMSLTRLTTTRIVLGKWFSIVSQTSLLLVSIIPYLVLRYFFGGMNILGEMVFLGLIFITSAFLTAITVGLSARNNRFSNLLTIGGIAALFTFVPSYVMRGFDMHELIQACAFEEKSSIVGVGLYLLAGAYLSWCTLNSGISLIAPTAENHSTIPRLISTFLVLGITAVSLTDDAPPEAIAFAFFVVLAPAFLRALTEPSILLPPICTPFLKRGVIGRIGALFLYPGWPAGVFFTVTMTAIALFACFRKSSILTDDQARIVMLSLLGSFFFPALLAQFFTKNETKRFINYILFLLATVTFTVLASTFLNVWDHKELFWLFAWNPSMYIPFADRQVADSSLILKCIGAVDSLIVLLMIVKASIAFRGYRPVIDEAEIALKPTDA